jgi:hypothetical protein
MMLEDFCDTNVAKFLLLHVTSIQYHRKNNTTLLATTNSTYKY